MPPLRFLLLFGWDGECCNDRPTPTHFVRRTNIKNECKVDCRNNNRLQHRPAHRPPSLCNRYQVWARSSPPPLPCPLPPFLAPPPQQRLLPLLNQGSLDAPLQRQLCHRTAITLVTVITTTLLLLLFPLLTSLATTVFIAVRTRDDRLLPSSLGILQRPTLRSSPPWITITSWLISMRQVSFDARLNHPPSWQSFMKAEAVKAAPPRLHGYRVPWVLFLGFHCPALWPVPALEAQTIQAAVVDCLEDADQWAVLRMLRDDRRPCTRRVQWRQL